MTLKNIILIIKQFIGLDDHFDDHFEKYFDDYDLYHDDSDTNPTKNECSDTNPTKNSDLEEKNTNPTKNSDLEEKKSYSDYLTLKNLILLLIALGLIGGGGYWLYTSGYFDSLETLQAKALEAKALEAQALEAKAVEELALEVQAKALEIQALETKALEDPTLTPECLAGRKKLFAAAQKCVENPHRFGQTYRYTCIRMKELTLDEYK